MNRIIKTALAAIMLLAVVALVGGCVPTTSTGEQDPNSTYYMIGFLVIIFALFYFVMIRPQRKRMKDQQQMMSNMQKGDKVITAGGIYGTIDNIGEDSIIMKVEGGTTLRVAKGSVAVLREQPQMKK